MQEVQLDSKIKLLDSPGIVFATGNDNSVSLKNAVRISAISDPITPANAILQRVSKQQMMEMYDIPEYNTPEVKNKTSFFFIIPIFYFRSFIIRKQNAQVGSKKVECQI